jgi:hypothetical protein
VAKKRRKQKPKAWHQPHEPIPAEIEARLTKPKTVSGLYQVQVLTVDGNRLVRPFPKVIQAVAEELCAAIKIQIAAGKERLWKEPHVVPVSLEQEPQIIV